MAAVDIAIAKIMDASADLTALGQSQEVARLRRMIGRLNNLILAAVSAAPSPAPAAVPAAPAVVTPVAEPPAPAAAVPPAPVFEYTRSEGRRFHRAAPWESRLQHGEPVLLAYNEKRGPRGEELEGTQYLVWKDRDGRVWGFLDQANEFLYHSPSALCKAKMHRNGETNDWDGPSHCFVQRNGQWVNLKNA